MRKLILSLLMLGVCFGGYSFAIHNGVILQSNYNNFKNDIVFIGSNAQVIEPFARSAWDGYYLYSKLTSPTATVTPFEPYYSGGNYVIGTNISISNFQITGTKLWTGFDTCSTYDCYEGWAFDSNSLSLGFFTYSTNPNPDEYTHFFTLNGMPSMNMNWFYHFSTLDYDYEPADVSTIRYITPLNTTFFDAYGNLSFITGGVDNDVVQHFKSDQVVTYTNGGTFVDSSFGANNSHYLLGPGTSFASITPMLSSDGYGDWEGLTLATISDNASYSQYGYGGNTFTSHGILLFSVNGVGGKRNSYTNTVVAISKDPADPRNLLGGIYPNCNCTTLDCMANYCTPSKIGHLIGKIDTNPKLGSRTCSSTGISTLLPYHAGGAGGLATYNTVNLNTVDNYYGGQFIDGLQCNPIPALFYYYSYQDISGVDGFDTAVVDVAVNGDYICFGDDSDGMSSLNEQCVQLVSSTTTSPLAGANEAYSGLYFLGNQFPGYGLTSGGTTLGYVFQVQSTIENIYGFTQSSCSSHPSTIYSGTILRSYSSGWSDTYRAMWHYCNLYEQQIMNGGPSNFSLSGFDTNFLDGVIYGSGMSNSTMFTCPQQYQETTNISLKISSFPFLSSLMNTTLGDMDLISPIKCLIGAFNYGMNYGSIASNLFTFQDNSALSISSNQLSLWSKFMSILLSIPALYLAFKRIL